MLTTFIITFAVIFILFILSCIGNDDFTFSQDFDNIFITIIFISVIITWIINLF